MLVSASWTFHTYREDKAAEAKKLQEERKREQDSFVLQHQAALYFDASRVAAILAASKDSKALHDARERFDQLFYGELVTVEDRRVELATISFQRCLDRDKIKSPDCERVSVNQHNRPLDPKNLNETLKPDLPQLSLEIGACARTALKDAWGIQFGLEVAGTNVEKPITTCPYD